MPQQDTSTDVPGLERLAAQVRGDSIRAVAHAKGGHLGGPLSAADLLVALYFNVMSVRPEEPGWPDRDRFILSKGHSSIALYATLAARGYFPRAELATFDAIDSRLQGHPDMTRLPGIDMSTGSLGQGISAGLGMALGAKLLGKSWRTWVMLGDGECQEGQVWEAAHVAPRYALDNLTVILDFNGFQQYGWPGATIRERRPPWPSAAGLAAIWRAFGWHTVEIDGHSLPQILAACAEAQAHRGAPTIIIAVTAKGQGVSFMAGAYEWHAKVPSASEVRQALAELGQDLAPFGEEG